MLLHITSSRPDTIYATNEVINNIRPSKLQVYSLLSLGIPALRPHPHRAGVPNRCSLKLLFWDKSVVKDNHCMMSQK